MPNLTYKLRTIFLVAFILFNLTGKAQYFHFSNLHENLFKINPSYITRNEKLSFQLLYRNQWPGLSDFITYDASLILTSERYKSSMGAYLYRDSQGGGIINNTNFSLLYAYKTRINRDVFFSAGLNGALQIYKTNFSGLSFENGQNPSSENKTIYQPEFSVGVNIDSKGKNNFGFSLSQLSAFFGAEQINDGLRYTASYSGRYVTNRGYSRNTTIFEPLVFASFSRTYNELLYGGRVNISGLVGGLYARQNFGFQFDALIILLGTHFGNMQLFYTYDLNLSGASAKFSNLASHEVTFLYNLEYKRKTKKRRGAIKCPNI